MPQALDARTAHRATRDGELATGLPEADSARRRPVQAAPKIRTAAGAAETANPSRGDRVQCSTDQEDTDTMHTPTFRPLAAYGIYLPTFAVSPKLAKETVYMPSQVAAQVLAHRNGALLETRIPSDSQLRTTLPKVSGR
jgi:hypothetical protein